jgi:hypothetical protein
MKFLLGFEPQLKQNSDHFSNSEKFYIPKTVTSKTIEFSQKARPLIDNFQFYFC